MIDEIKRNKIIPVVKIDERFNIDKFIKSLEEAGCYFCEVTFRNDYAPIAIEKISKSYPDFCVGAGTVISQFQALQAIKAGAEFVVSPGFSTSVNKICRQNSITYIPGCVTPTDIMTCLDNEISNLKFFPSESFGGIKTLKALSAPFPQVSFMPTGGINLDNISSYFKLKNVFAVGGSFMVNELLIENGEYEQITKILKDAYKLIENA